MTDRVVDAVEILKLLPHRYPFVLVDRVESLIEHESIHAIKNVTINEPFFTGHFPGNPVMPGVLMIEAMAQASGILAKISANLPDGQVIVLAGVDQVRFKRMVRPGDVLNMYIQVTHQRSKIWKFQGRCEVDGQVACQAELMIAS